MQVELKVEYTEQAKAVVANTKAVIVQEVDMQGLEEAKNQVLKIAREMFDTAFAYAKMKSMEK